MVGSGNAVKRARAIYVRRKCHDCVGDPIETIPADAVEAMRRQHVRENEIERIRLQAKLDQEWAATRDNPPAETYDKVREAKYRFLDSDDYDEYENCYEDRYEEPL